MTDTYCRHRNVTGDAATRLWACTRCEASFAPKEARTEAEGRLAAVEAALAAYFVHLEMREPYRSDFKPDDGRHFDGDGCFAALERAYAWVDSPAPDAPQETP
jgi:hypothetical protein